MIWRFQPFNVNKEIGIDYNVHCAAVRNDEDWIQITDFDCQLLCREAYRVIEQAIARYPDTAIFGAVANRLGRKEQRLNQAEPDGNDSMRWHIAKAKELAEQYKDGECFEVKSVVAGFFMLFRKSYWNVQKFQDKVMDNRGLLFDYNFCNHARVNKLPMRVIKGLYVWHSYRIDQAKWHDYSHLKG